MESRVHTWTACEVGSDRSVICTARKRRQSTYRSEQRTKNEAQGRLHLSYDPVTLPSSRTRGRKLYLRALSVSSSLFRAPRRVVSSNRMCTPPFTLRSEPFCVVGTPLAPPQESTSPASSHSPLRDVAEERIRSCFLIMETWKSRLNHCD